MGRLTLVLLLFSTSPMAFAAMSNKCLLWSGTYRDPFGAEIKLELAVNENGQNILIFDDKDRWIADGNFHQIEGQDPDIQSQYNINDRYMIVCQSDTRLTVISEDFGRTTSDDFTPLSEKDPSRGFHLHRASDGRVSDSDYFKSER